MSFLAGGKIFNCSTEKCSYSTSHRHLHTRHVKRCSEAESMISCKFPNCKYASFSTIIVKKHSIKEHGLDCPRCDFFTKSKTELKKHMKTHPQGNLLKSIDNKIVRRKDLKSCTLCYRSFLSITLFTREQNGSFFEWKP